MIASDINRQENTGSCWRWRSAPKPHGELHDLLPVIEAGVECHLAALDGAQFGADAVLLAPEHVTSMAFARGSADPVNFH